MGGIERKTIQSISGGGMKLEASWETEIILGEDGRVWIHQRDDPNEEAIVILAPHQIKLVADELYRLIGKYPE